MNILATGIVIKCSFELVFDKITKNCSAYFPQTSKAGDGFGFSLTKNPKTDTIEVSRWIIF